MTDLYLLVGFTDATSNPKSESKPEGSTNADAAKPLAPPPRPGQQNNNTGKTPDYFAAQANASLSLEPNPFEQSFGGGAPETPGGTKLPPVAALASPSSLLPGSAVTPFNWGGGSLRTGPLSPAMLSGPAGDYFSEGHHLRGGFPTPNESSLRTGLTPGGSGSMFPAPSPNSQAMFAHLASGGATPSTIDFHRTAMSAAAKRDQNGGHQQEGQQPQGVPTQQQPSNLAAQGSGVSNVNGAPVVKNEPKPASGPFDPHDNDAANGLFMLAQGRNGTQPADQYTTTSGAPSHAQVAAVPPQGMSTSPQMGHVNGVATQGHGLSEGSNDSDDSEPSKPATRGKKRSAATAGRKKTDDLMSKAPPSKKAKGMDGMPTMSPESDPEDDMKTNADGTRVKMTDEEKRKNFLERNRFASLPLYSSCLLTHV